MWKASWGGEARFNPVRGGEMVREDFAHFDDPFAERAGGQGSPRR